MFGYDIYTLNNFLKQLYLYTLIKIPVIWMIGM